MGDRTLVICDDLFFWASIRDTARAAGREAVRAGDEAALRREIAAGGIARVVADLGAGLDPVAWAPHLKALDPPPRMVAFGSHVDGAALARARDAGFDEVLPRSRFARELRERV